MRYVMIFAMMLLLIAGVWGSALAQTPEEGVAHLSYYPDTGEYGINWYRPDSIPLDSSPAENLVAVPPASGGTRLYGAFTLGDGDDPTVSVIIDIINQTEYVGILDANNNEDLTDDPSFRRTKPSSFDVDSILVDYSSGPDWYSLRPYYYDRDPVTDYRLAYYRDCLYGGKVILGGIEREVAVLDDDCDGTYDDIGQTTLIIDLNGDGEADGSSQSDERVDPATKTFYLDGLPYRVKSITVKGDTAVFEQIPWSQLNGTVSDAQTGRPVIGAIVAISPGSFQDTTGADGGYSVTLGTGPDYTLSLVAGGFVPVSEGNIDIGSTPVTLDLPIDRIPVITDNQVTLEGGDSYHFLTGERGQYSGGDFYFGVYSGQPTFWANNIGQRGLQDLGDLGDLALESAQIPQDGYYRHGVEAVAGHTYVSLTREGEEGHYIVFRVMALSALQVTIEYYYTPGGSGSMAGTVRDAAGTSVADVTISSIDLSQVTTTGSDGNYVLAVPEGAYDIVASRGGYMPSDTMLVSVLTGQLVPLDFVLSADGTIPGCEVKLPTVSARPGQILLLPVVVNVSAEEIVSSAEMAITYDSDVLRILEATTLNTLAEDWITEYDIHRGQTAPKDTIRIAMATVKDTLSESSILVFLRAIVSEHADPGDMSELVFERFRFNEGDPSVETVDGMLTVVSLLGDVSENGEVGAYDASLVLRHVVGLITLTGPDSAIADVSGNGTLSALDAALILRYSVGMISRFPAEGGIAKLVGSERSIALGLLESTDGDLLRVPISIDDMAGVLAGDLELRFDPSKVAFVEVRASDRTEAYQFAVNGEEDRIRVSFAGVESPAGGGRIAEVILRSVESGAELRERQTDLVGGLTIHRVSLNEGMIPVRVEAFKVEAPKAYRLGQSYPNPFNPETTIQYDVAKTGVVRLSVYALTGQLVRTLMDGERPAGRYSVVWDGTDDAGRDVASGVYLCRMEAGEYSAVRKMLLVR